MEGTKRSFTVLDAMILVAAIGTGLGLMKVFVPFYFYQAHFSDFVTREGVFLLVFGSFPLPGMAAFFFPLIRLRKPRPGRQELLRQPGLMASIVASLGMAVSGLLALRLSFLNDFSIREGSVVEAIELMMCGVGCLVAGAWLAMVMTGCWRPERSWVDRLGRCIGLVWIALPILCATVCWLMPITIE